MADYPFLPFDVQAYLGSTRHLTTEQHGAYVLLLMEAWQRPNCTLPDDDKILSAYCCMSIEQWASVKPLVMEFWQYDKRSKGWSQKRLKKERKYVASVKQKKRDAAVNRWKKTKKDDASAYAPAMQHSPSLSPSLIPSKKEGFLFDEKKWFGLKEVEFLEASHPEIDIRSKLEENGFREWAFKTNPKDPLTPARNAIRKLARTYESESSLILAAREAKEMKFGDMGHLQEALNKKGKN